jgi:D-xylonolactonase
MTSDVEVLADIGCEVGEGVLWHPDETRVYWTDIPSGNLYRYDPEPGAHERLYDGETVGGFTFQNDGSLLLCMTEGTVKTWRDGDLETVIDGLPGEAGMRFNDVIADPAGRVFCGTMDTDDPSVGRLYRIDTDGTVTTVLDPVGLPNGMGFTPDRERLYLTESNANTIHRFDYDEETGELSNRQVFTEFDGENGMYDGLTVDADGGVWSALWGGGALVRHAPDGGIERRLPVPATNVTSLTFGGPAFRDVYISSATLEAPPDEPHAGGLFHTNVDVRGTSEFTSKVQP